MVPQYFIEAAADGSPARGTCFIEGETPEQALSDYARAHPPYGREALFPLLFVDLYESAEAFHKGERPLATLYKCTSAWYRKHAPEELAEDRKKNMSNSKKLVEEDIIREYTDL